MKTFRRIVIPALAFLLAFAGCKKQGAPPTAASATEEAEKATTAEAGDDRAEARKTAGEQARAARGATRKKPARVTAGDDESTDETTGDAAGVRAKRRDRPSAPEREPKKTNRGAAARAATADEDEAGTADGDASTRVKAGRATGSAGGGRRAAARTPGDGAGPSGSDARRAGDRAAALLGPRLEAAARFDEEARAESGKDGPAPRHVQANGIRREPPTRPGGLRASRRSDRDATPAAGRGHRPAPAAPAVPTGLPLHLGALLSLDEVRSVTKTSARLEADTLGGIPASPAYNAIYYRDHREGRFGVAVQVWKDPRSVSPLWRFGQMVKTYPNVTENTAVTPKTFFAYWRDVYYLVFLVEKQRMTVAMSCGNHICKDPDHLVDLGRRVAERIEKR